MYRECSLSRQDKLKHCVKLYFFHLNDLQIDLLQESNVGDNVFLPDDVHNRLVHHESLQWIKLEAVLLLELQPVLLVLNVLVRETEVTETLK